MISYKYKLCKSKKLRVLDHMMAEAAFANAATRTML